MKIHTRFLLFLLVSVALYVAALAALRQASERVGVSLLEAQMRETAQHLEQVLRLERAPIEHALFDNTFWDEMLAFVERPDPDWGVENIDDALPVFGVDYAWVYDAQLRRVYAMAPPERATGAAAEAVEPSGAAVRAAVGRAPFAHYFAPGPDAGLYEYFTAPIQPSDDATRETVPRGWLVAARHVGPELLGTFGGAVGGPVTVQRLDGGAVPDDRIDAAAGRVVLFEPLPDAAGAPVAILRAVRTNPGLPILAAALSSYNTLYLVFAVVNLLLLGLFVIVWVRNPLQRVSQSLDRQDLAPAARYLEARHEFGTIARLIRTFFAQREALLGEIEMRKRSEEHLREARDLADRSARAKSEFLSVMSHELRTPLNAVIGLASLLLEERPRPDQAENLQTLKLSAEHLLSLINDVLDFNKMDAGKLALAPRAFDPAALVTTLARTFAPQAEAKGIALETAVGAGMPAAVVGDPLRLTQVLSNLLSNAIKFTREGGVTLSVAASAAGAQNTRLSFRVADTGIGIPPEKHALIFERFTQADSDTTREFGGTGLGLTIASRLAQLMGADIALDSAPGRGSTFAFTVVLPRAAAPAPDHEAAATAVDHTGQRVLVVEDNAVNLQLAVRFLRKWGFAVETAVDGVAAVEIAARERFDLILMDLHMPRMSGVESTIRIRADGGPNAATPILAFTATAPGADDADIRAAGFAGYITKPIDPAALRAAIERYLTRR